MLVLTEKTEAKACRLTRDYIRMGFVERLHQNLLRSDMLVLPEKRNSKHAGSTGAT
jgi:hypothetical protein